MEFLHRISQQAVQFFVSLFTSQKVRKFVLTGCVAGIVYVCLFGMLTAVFDMWYVWAIIFASVLCTIVKFPVQKVFTFESKDLARTHHEFAYYACVEGGNAGLNIWGVNILHWHFHLSNFLAQCIVGIPTFALVYLICSWLFESRTPA